MPTTFDPESPDLPRKAKPVIAWPGGKARMLKHILPLIPAHGCYKLSSVLAAGVEDKCGDLQLQIERSGASPELTACSVLAANLQSAIRAI